MHIGFQKMDFSDMELFLPERFSFLTKLISIKLRILHGIGVTEAVII